jgi:hypothetical protein
MRDVPTMIAAMQVNSGNMKAGLVFALAVLLAGPARAEVQPVPGYMADGEALTVYAPAADPEPQQLVEVNQPAETRPDPCRQFDGEYESWIDRNQVLVYRTVCGTAAWIDGFFGESRYDRETGETYGRIGVSTFWDERDGSDTDVRFRARFAFPAMRERGDILIGRGDEQELIEERTTFDEDAQAASTTTDGENSLYVGFGFRGLQKDDRGLDYSVGLRLRSSPEVFAKTSYRREWQIGANSLFKIRPIIYWRSDEGVGSTLNLEYDYLINKSMLYRFSNFANVSEDKEVEGVAWGSAMSFYQVLSRRRALTYSIFASGETKADVELQNYGFEFRYRQRILRKWLFIEYLGRVSWPREFLLEKRETNFGAGIKLEAYFGPAPESWVR